MSARACALPRAPLAFVIISLVGCSALVDPDPGRLGGGEDSGVIIRVDGGPSGDGGPGPMTDGGLADGGPDPVGDAGCVPRCEGDTLRGCERDERCDLGCLEGPARCGRFAPSNVPAELVDRGSADIRIGDGTYNTTTCMANMATAMVVPQEDGGELCALIVRSFRLTGTLTVRGDRPLAIVASESIEIDAGAILDASASAITSGPGGGSGGTPSNPNGGGLGGGSPGAQASLDDGGGGGASFCGRGGNGGLGGSSEGGLAGELVATDALSPLSGGSGGGIGPGGSTSGGTLAGLGGAGGGGIQLSAAGSIRIDGIVTVGGGGGRGGRTSTTSNWGAGGGGGSGGGLLVESPEVTVSNSDQTGLLASGGGGGGGAGSGRGGSNGTDGRLFLTRRAPGGESGNFNDQGNGGDSAGGEEPDGEDGDDAPANNGNGGGGGGGGGCVVIRSADGALPENASDRSSPRSAATLVAARVRVR